MFPAAIQIAKVVPIHKSGSSQDVLDLYPFYLFSAKY